MGAVDGVPQVGALVEVTLTGHAADRYNDGFWLRVGKGTAEIMHWVPDEATVKVLKPALPTEVLLLECGHVMDHPRPASTAGTAYCWRFPCHAHKAVVGVSSVSW